MPAQRLLTAALRLAPDPGPADRDLLAAFAATRDETAFARVTGHAQDAEDAFQAAFLVLARRAGQLSRPDQLGNWMYGVAVRTALDARSTRRRIRETALADAPEPAALPPPPPDADLAGVLDEELARLPEKYRAAVVLCELEGVPRRDAAARLGIPEGTLSSRLAHARKLLATRLARRGIVAPVGLFAALGPTGGGAAVPAALIDYTARVAARAAGGAVPPGLVSDRVSSLTDGVLKTMFVSKLRLTAGVVALAVAALGAAAVVGQQPRAVPQPDDPFAVAKQPAARATAPAQGKEPEKIPAKGIEDDDVPYATIPAPAVVRLEGGKLIVRQRTRGGVAYYVPAAQSVGKLGNPVVGQKYDPSDILVFDMKGNRLSPKTWRAKFEQDQHVLIAWGGVVPNPRELVLFKDDTLVVVLPGMPAGGGQFPAARTPYRAIQMPDGTVQYQPVTYYEGPTANEVPPAAPLSAPPTLQPYAAPPTQPVPESVPPTPAANPSPFRRNTTPAPRQADTLPPATVPGGLQTM
ncbi:RNA polymerase sigma factor [bacterium]|nr:RNA polymerase sigma factor [bacterium]